MLPRKNLVNQLGKFWINHRPLTTSTVSNLNQKYRRDRGLPLNPNATGVLTDGPDYSFLDGRITPYGVGQHDRILREKDTLKQVLSLSQEIDFAVERHKNLLAEEEKKRQAILDSKLKPKGKNLLLKSSDPTIDSS